MLDKLTKEAIDIIKKSLKEDKNKIIFIFGLNGTGKSLTAKEFFNEGDIAFLGDNFENTDNARKNLKLKLGFRSGNEHSNFKKQFQNELKFLNLPNTKKVEGFQNIFKYFQNETQLSGVLKELDDEIKKTNFDLNTSNIDEEYKYLEKNKDIFEDIKGLFKFYKNKIKPSFSELWKKINKIKNIEDLKSLEKEINDKLPTIHKKDYWNELKEILHNMNSYIHDETKQENFSISLKTFFDNEKSILCLLCGKKFTTFEDFKKEIFEKKNSFKYRNKIIKFCEQEIKKIDMNEKKLAKIQSFTIPLDELKNNIKKLRDFKELGIWVKEKLPNMELLSISVKDFYDQSQNKWVLENFLKIEKEDEFFSNAFKQTISLMVKTYELIANKYIYSKYYEKLMDGIETNKKRLFKSNTIQIKNNDLFIKELQSHIENYLFFEKNLLDINFGSNKEYIIEIKGVSIQGKETNDLELSRSQIKIIELVFTILFYKHHIIQKPTNEAELDFTDDRRELDLIVDDPIDSNDDINAFITKSILRNHIKDAISNKGSRKIIIFSHLKFTFKNLININDPDIDKRVSFYNLNSINIHDNDFTNLLEEQDKEKFFYDFEEQASSKIKEIMNGEVKIQFIKEFLIINHFFLNRYTSKKLWVYDIRYLRSILDKNSNKKNQSFCQDKIKGLQFDTISKNLYKYSEGEDFKKFIEQLSSFFYIDAIQKYFKTNISHFKNTNELLEWVKNQIEEFLDQIQAQEKDQTKEGKENTKKFSPLNELLISFKNHYDLIDIRISIQLFLMKNVKEKSCKKNFWNLYKKFSEEKKGSHKYKNLLKFVEMHKYLIDENIHQNKILKIFECNKYISVIKNKLESLIKKLN